MPYLSLKEIGFDEKEFDEYQKQYGIDLETLKSRADNLIEDFEKDEKQKLDQLQKDFYHYFNMPRTAVMKEVEDFDGCLEDFYNYCQAQFGPRQEKINKRVRKPKNYLAP